MKIVLIYLIIINVIGFGIMYIDKRRAIKQVYRIPEARLWIIAIIGGALGSTLGMRVFRHKTKHRSFVIGFPLLVILQIVILYFIANQYLI